MYGAVKLLPPDVVRNTVRACCGDAVCLRRVAWEVDADTPLALPDEGDTTGEARVPCPEACSMFVSFARQVLVLERAPRMELAGLGRLGVEEIAQVREIATHAAAGTLGTAREGEFTRRNELAADALPGPAAGGGKGAHRRPARAGAAVRGVSQGGAVPGLPDGLTAGNREQGIGNSLQLRWPSPGFVNLTHPLPQTAWERVYTPDAARAQAAVAVKFSPSCPRSGGGGRGEGALARAGRPPQ